MFREHKTWGGRCDGERVRRTMNRSGIAIACKALSLAAAILVVAEKERLVQIPRYPVACDGFSPFAP